MVQVPLPVLDALTMAFPVEILTHDCVRSYLSS
jgi:hypothetical protein